MSTALTSHLMMAPHKAVTPGAFLLGVLDRGGFWQEENRVEQENERRILNQDSVEI